MKSQEAHVAGWSQKFKQYYLDYLFPSSALLSSACSFSLRQAFLQHQEWSPPTLHLPSPQRQRFQSKKKKKNKLLSPGIYTVSENKFLYMTNYNLKGNKNSLLINYLHLYLLTGEDFWGGGSWWQRSARKAHFASFYFLSYHAACWILFSNQRLNMHASGVLTAGLSGKFLRKVHFGWCIILSTTFPSPFGEFVIILYWI